MPDHFDSKAFNAEAFKYSVDRIPNLKQNEIQKSGAIVGNPDIKAAFGSQNGTGFASIAMRGLLEGDAVNYDGQTNITATRTKTFEQGVVVVGRAKGFIETDFSHDITGGVDFMQNVAAQVADYLDGIDEKQILDILKGIFSMPSGTKNLEFIDKHTTTVDGNMQATTLNSATNKACGANKKKFALVFMHSDVATNIENLNLVERLKYTDKDGISRELDLATWNGKLVVVDDEMPTEVKASTAGVYTVTVAGTVASGDKITVAGKEVTLDSTSGASVTAAATAVVSALGTMESYTINRSAGVITFTEKEGHYGAGAPSASIVSTAGTVAVATTTEPTYYTEYTTYALGKGSLFREDIGAKVPYEMFRDPATNGGEDTLYVRRRKCVAPYGISYKKYSQVTKSPTDAELANGANWELVHSGEENDEDRSYINHKAIPIVRILSKG